MSYFHETIWKGVPKFLRRVDTALKNIGINERVPYNAPVIQFSSWMGGDRDGTFLLNLLSCTANFWMILVKMAQAAWFTLISINYRKCS